MKTDGQTFKEIRKSRKISQKEVTRDTISRATISKFENDKIVLSTDRFIFLLDSIDISLEEFNYIKNNYTYNKKEKIIFLFNQLFSSSEITLIDELIILCNDYLKYNFSRSIKCILNALFVMKHINNNTEKLNCLSKIYVSNIWNELSKIDDWTILDLKIINCCLHFFEPNTYILISEQVIKSLTKYQSFSNINLLEASIYLNLTILFLLQNNFEYAKKFSALSLSSSYKNKRLDYIAIALIRYGIINKDSKSIDKGLILIDILKDSELEKAIKDEINQFKHI